MAFKINSFKKDLIDFTHEEAINKLNEFYEVNFSKSYIKIFLIEDRETYNLLNGKETEHWMIGFSQGRNVFIFDIDVIENVTLGFHKKNPIKYSKIIKHEIAHCYFRLYNNGKSDKFPVSRLNEGMSIYLSGQLEDKKSVDIFSEFLEYWEYGSKGVYAESGFVVKILVENYGKNKILNLIKSIEFIENKNQFLEKFNEIYGFELNYENINNLVN